MGEENKEQKALTYDELKDVCNQLQQQNTFLRTELQKHAGEDFFKRIEYLFKVLEHKNTFANTDNGFVDEVISELISILNTSESKLRYNSQIEEEKKLLENYRAMDQAARLNIQAVGDAFAQSKPRSKISGD